MSEFEKNVNEMDAAEMLRQHREEHPVEGQSEDQTEGRTTEEWTMELIREFDDNAKRWHRRQGWEAFSIAGFHALSVVACCAALLGCYWQLVLVGMAAANLLMAGGWLHKAKAGWQV